MNKILLYTDNHFCTNSSILRKRGNRYSLRLENQLQTMEWLVEQAQLNNCSDIICLGDFFDKPVLNAEELACLSEIDFKDLNTGFIVGNHEMSTSNLDYSSAHSFLINQSAEVYNKPSIIGIGNTLIYILPYQLEINRKEHVFDYFPDIEIPSYIKYKILLMHNDIAGINMGHFISKEGFDKSDLSNNFDLVVNGHIHNQQWVTDNVVNLGNITGQNFSEDAIRYKHQCMIIDCDTLEYSFITNPYALNFSKIDFTGKYNDIDYINSISPKMGNNAVVSIKCEKDSFYYIKHRFDPDSEEIEHIPRNCNILQSRITVVSEVEDNVVSDKLDTLHLDHIKEFKDYILQKLGTSELVQSELQEIT